MKKALAIIGLALLVCAPDVSAQPVEGSLDRLRALVPSLPAAIDSNEIREYAGIISRIVEQGKSNSTIRDRIARQIGDYARKPGFDPDRSERPSDAEKHDFVYAMQLLDVLARVDRSTFLDSNQKLLTDSQVQALYKTSLFQKVLSQRVTVGITDPNALPDYDRRVLSLGMELLDRADGLRLTFGSRSEFRNFVGHLIGYELHSNVIPTLPPIDREKGLEFAREFVADGRFSFIEKEWYMGQLARFDPQVRGDYIRVLEKYIDDANLPKHLRVKYAEKLAALGQLDQAKLEALRNLPPDPTIVRIKIRNGEAIRSSQENSAPAQDRP